MAQAAAVERVKVNASMLSLDGVPNWDPITGLFITLKPRNGLDFGREPPETKGLVRDFVVLGGGMANNGEDAASSLVLNNSAKLERVIYLPWSYKGGAFVRPHYCHGDREKEELFPALREVWCIKAPNVANPASYGWQAPRLKRLVFGYFLSVLPEPEFIPSNILKEPGEVTNEEREMLKAYPELDEIVYGATWPTEGLRLHVFCRVLTPKVLDWRIHRLLLVAHMKEDPSSCPFASLPEEIFNVIVDQLRRRWTRLPSTIDQCTHGEALFPKK